MNKRQKEVIQSQLNDERTVLKSLEKNYTSALADIKRNIKELQANPLTQSKAYQLDFQKQLEKQVAGIVDNLQGKNFSSVADYLNTCYNQSFLGTMYDIQGQGIPLIFPIDQKQVLKAVQKTSDDIKLSKKIAGTTEELKKTVLSELQRGLSTSMSYADIARNISSHGSASLSRSMTIARTEGHRVQNVAKMDSLAGAKARGADVVKQWDSTLDGATRDTHRRLDGQVRELDEDFEVDGMSAPYPGGFGDPAEDCNCRCCILQRARWAVEKESGYDKMNNETGEIIKCSGFADFQEKYLDAAENLKNSEESDIIREYNSELAQKFGKEHYDGMRDLVESCPDSNLSSVWDAYEDKIKVGDPQYKGHEHCRRDEIYVNGSRDAVGSSWEAPYQVSFHESGHAIDYLARSEANSSNFAWFYSNAYENGKFPTTIKKEVSDWVKTVNETLKAEFKGHKGDIEWMHDHGYIDNWYYDFYKKNGYLLGGEPKYSISFAYKAIEKEIRALEPRAKADLSDILEGATGGKISIGFGHGASYWKKGGNDALATEAFAEMLDSTMTCPKSLETIKKYLPDSYSVFQDMIKALKKG